MKRKLALPALLLTVVSAAVTAVVILLVYDRISGPPAAERAAYAPQQNRELPVLWPAPQQELTAHSGETVSSKSLEGKVWVASFIFTTCTTVCPMITASQMALMRRMPDPTLRFVSYSVDPETDTVERLRAYKQQWNADDGRWLLLRPTTAQLPGLAQAMRVDVAETDDPQNKIMHSSMFFLVDQQANVRGVYNSNDDRAIERLVTDTSELLGQRMPSAPPHADAPGKQIYERLSCGACHDNPQLAPSLRGIADTERELEGGGKAHADRVYIEESIVAPGKRVVAGYLKLMPSYEAHLNQAELKALTDHVLSLSSVGGSENGSPGSETASTGSNQESGDIPATAASIVIDPVCDMKVRITPETPQVDHAGEPFHFCSQSCADRFAADPAAFLNK